MQDFISSPFKLGILGGGQLGKMLILSTANFDVYTKVLDPDAACSSATYCNEFVQGSFNDYETVLAFGADCDVITVEIEHVNTDALKELKKQGKAVHPDPDALEIIKDKGLQKMFYAEHKLPSSSFFLVDSADEIRERVEEGALDMPFVQKSRLAGYDGKGVKVVRSKADLADLIPGPALVEQAVKIKKELAVIVAQSDADADSVAFDVVDMDFNAEANLVEYLYCPADISETIKNEAIALAKKVLNAFGIRGLLAVELFLDENDKLLVNEVAPRPHNSGHHTIDSCFTSQFEQHFRSILNLPLGSTKSKCAAVMGNILGDANYTGAVKYAGVLNVLAKPGVKFHIYGKKTTKPFRKMGHFTVLAETINEAKTLAIQVNKELKVIA